MVSKNLKKIVKDKTSVFLLDLSWHLHRSWHSFKWMSVDMGGYQRPTGHMYGVLNAIVSIRHLYPNSAIILCQDGVPLKRIEMYKETETEYKSDRADLEFNFYADIKYIKLMAFACPNIYWAYHPEEESDDIMYALAKQIETISDAKVYIYSGDDDLLQTITDQISVIRVMDKKGFIEIDNYYVQNDKTMRNKFHGVDSYHLPYFRAIIGDKSDKIKGLPRFSRELAKRIAMSSNSLEDLLSFFDKKSENYSEVIETVSRNYSLMKLSEDIEVPLSRSKINYSKFREIAATYRMSRYIKFIREEC